MGVRGQGPVGRRGQGGAVDRVGTDLVEHLVAGRAVEGAAAAAVPAQLEAPPAGRAGETPPGGRWQVAGGGPGSRWQVAGQVAVGRWQGRC